MTTNQLTPYDQEIAGLKVLRQITPEEGLVMYRLRLQREGYLAAVADHADLLAAAESLIEVCDTGRPLDFVTLISKVCEQARAALAKHRGE